VEVLRANGPHPAVGSFAPVGDDGGISLGVRDDVTPRGPDVFENDVRRFPSAAEVAASGPEIAVRRIVSIFQRGPNRHDIAIARGRELRSARLEVLAERIDLTPAVLGAVSPDHELHGKEAPIYRLRHDIGPHHRRVAELVDRELCAGGQVAIIPIQQGALAPRKRWLGGTRIDCFVRASVCVGQPVVRDVTGAKRKCTSQCSCQGAGNGKVAGACARS